MADQNIDLGNTDSVTFNNHTDVEKVILNGETIWELGGAIAESAKIDTLNWYQVYGGRESTGISNPRKVPLGGYIDGQDGANGGYYKDDIAIKFNSPEGTYETEWYDSPFGNVSSWIPEGSGGIKSLRVSQESSSEIIMVTNDGQVLSKSGTGKLRGDGVLTSRYSFDKFKVQEFDGGHPKLFLPHAWNKRQGPNMGPLTTNAPGKFGYASDHLTLPNWSGFSSSTSPSDLYQDGGGVQLPATGDIINAHSITGFTHEGDDWQHLGGFFINSDEGVFATLPFTGDPFSRAVRFSRYGAIQGFAYNDSTLWTGTTFVNGLILNPMSQVTYLGLSYPEQRRTFSKSLTELKGQIEGYSGEVLETKQSENSIGNAVMTGGDFSYYSNMCGSWTEPYLYRELDGTSHNGWYGFDWYGGFRFSENAKKVFMSGNKRLLGYLPFKGNLYSPSDSTGFNLVLLYEGDRQEFLIMPPSPDNTSCSLAYNTSLGANRENIRHPRSGQIFIKPSGTFKVNDRYTYSWTSKSAYWHWHDTHVNKWDTLMTEDGLIPSDEVHYVKASDTYDHAHPAAGKIELPRLNGDTLMADDPENTTVTSGYTPRQGNFVASQPVGSFAMVVGDTFWAWGQNLFGELGIGDYAHLYPDADDGDWVSDTSTGWIKKRALPGAGEWKEQPSKNASGDYTHFVRNVMWGKHLYQPVYVKYDHDGNEIKNIKDIAVCNQGILILKTDGTLLASGRFWKPIAYCSYGSTSMNTASTSLYPISVDPEEPTLGPVITANTPSLITRSNGKKVTAYPAPIYPSRFEDTGLVDIEAISAASLTGIIVQKAGSSNGYLWELGYETLTSTQTINSNKTGSHVTGI